MLEEFLSQVWYWFNSIETYVFTAGIFLYLILTLKKIKKNINFIFYLLFLLIIFIFSNFHPLFLPFIIFSIILMKKVMGYDKEIIKKIFLYQVIIYYCYIVFAWGGLYAFISKDITVPLRYLYLTLITFSDTSANAIQTIIFSSFITIFLVVKPKFNDSDGRKILLVLIVGSIITGLYVLSLLFDYKININPPIEKKIAERVIVISVDGLRYDKFLQANTPFLDSLKRNGSFYINGMSSMYRTKTEVDFSTILSGTPPIKHGVLNNLYCCGLKVETLPDILNTTLYGTVHFKDLENPDWEVKTISTLKHYYDADEKLIEFVKKDLIEGRKELLIIDLIFVDQIGHTYGSDSIKYINAIEKTDKLINEFFEWMKENNLLENTTIFFLADHGQQGMDHGFMLFSSEKYVPLILWGSGIKKNNKLENIPSIMDISPTISYLLGANYTKNNFGRALIESIEV